MIRGYWVGGGGGYLGTSWVVGCTDGGNYEGPSTKIWDKKMGGRVLGKHGGSRDMD